MLLRRRRQEFKAPSELKVDFMLGEDISLSPDEIEICKRPDGSPWLLGEGNFASVRTFCALRNNETETQSSY